MPMKNLSQKMKLLMIFFVTCIIPVLFMDLYSIFSSKAGMNSIAVNLISQRLEHDIVSANMYLNSYSNTLTLKDGQLLTEDGTNLASNPAILQTISNKLDVETILYVNEGTSFGYLCSNISNSTALQYFCNQKPQENDEIYDSHASQKYQVGGNNSSEQIYHITYSKLTNASGEVIGLIAVVVPNSYAIQLVRPRVVHQILSMTKITIIIGVLGIIFIIFASKMFTRPLLSLKEYAKSLSNFDFTFNIPKTYLERKDENGVVANAVQLIIENTRELVTLVHEKSDIVAQIANELNTTCSQSNVTSNELSNTMNEIAESITSQATDTAQCQSCLNTLGEHVQNNETMVSELAVSSDRVSSYVEEGKRVLGELSARIDESNKATQILYDDIQVTNESANHISNISSMIASIATQTNLLALNASIEAARAGEAGSGFSVVAEEIRKLAEQSADATKQIDEQIRLLQHQANNSVDTTSRVKDMLEAQIVSIEETQNQYSMISNEMTATMEIIHILKDSSDEMAKQKDTATNNISSLSAVAQENAAAAEEANACIEEQTASLEELSTNSNILTSMANDLDQLIQKFKVS